jgi:uncharacterized protein involved in exopolysaccharide biosynthesis
MMTSPKVYRAMARIKVSPPAFPGPWFPQTELEVIASEPVLASVVERLNLAEQWEGNVPEALHSNGLKLLTRSNTN